MSSPRRAEHEFFVRVIHLMMRNPSSIVDTDTRRLGLYEHVLMQKMRFILREKVRVVSGSQIVKFTLSTQRKKAKKNPSYGRPEVSKGKLSQATFVVYFQPNKIGESRGMIS